MTEVRGQMTEENRRVEQSSAAAISAGIEASPTFFFLIFRQDLPDNSGLFIILSHFPDGSEKTQSVFGGIIWFIKLIVLRCSFLHD